MKKLMNTEKTEVNRSVDRSLGMLKGKTRQVCSHEKRVNELTLNIVDQNAYPNHEASHHQGK